MTECECMCDYVCVCEREREFVRVSVLVYVIVGWLSENALIIVFLDVDNDDNS